MIRAMYKVHLPYHEWLDCTEQCEAVFESQQHDVLPE